jgi:hypothetical protein
VCGPRRRADDEYFLDRDGPSFRHVLNYLRAPAGAAPLLPRGDDYALELLRQEVGCIQTRARVLVPFRTFIKVQSESCK